MLPSMPYLLLFLAITVHAVNGVEITIQNGPTVEVGERVSIVCSCNIFSECPNEVHFEIRGVKYNFTTLKNGGVPGYRFTPDEDSSSFIVNHKLILVSATMDDSGTTYRCMPSLPDGHVTEWSNRETLTVRAAVPKVANQITMSVEPQTAAVGDDVKIKCAHNISSVIDYYPRIAANSQTYTVDTLTSSEKYSLTNSTVINGVAVLVLALHNVGMTDNETTFQCYFRLNGGMEIRSNVAALMVHNRDTEAVHQITISLKPSSATVGDEVQITCAHNISEYSSIIPRIKINGQPHTADTLSSIKGYKLTSSPYSDEVLVLTLHNVTRSHNGTTFECYFRGRSRGTRISSGTDTLLVREKVITTTGSPNTATTTSAELLYSRSQVVNSLSTTVCVHGNSSEDSTGQSEDITVNVHVILVPTVILAVLLLVCIGLLLFLAIALGARSHGQNMRRSQFESKESSN